MLKIYQDAITLFGIEQGFVEEQLDWIYQTLLACYKLENLEEMNTQYCSIGDNKTEIEMAYQLLKEPFSHYIVSRDSKVINKEQMIEEISRLIYDYHKKGIIVDHRFIAKIVEILVAYNRLHAYVKDIEFRLVSKNMIAGYHDSKTLRIYDYNLKKAFSLFTIGEAKERCYFPYYRTVASLGHEMEHAKQKRMWEQRENDIRSILSQICNHYKETNDINFERIANFPEPIFVILDKLLQIRFSMDYKKYEQNWMYSPEERMADISGNLLALTLLDHVVNKKELENLKTYFYEKIMDFLLYGYDRLLGPTDFYLSQFRQYKERLKILGMSKSLKMEERLLLGLYLTSKERKEVEKNKEKMLSKIQTIC